MVASDCSTATPRSAAVVLEKVVVSMDIFFVGYYYNARLPAVGRGRHLSTTLSGREGIASVRREGHTSHTRFDGRESTRARAATPAPIAGEGVPTRRVATRGASHWRGRVAIRPSGLEVQVGMFQMTHAYGARRTRAQYYMSEHERNVERTADCSGRHRMHASEQTHRVS
jgi:hypothetical protein